jgi:hypothetical protein
MAQAYDPTRTDQRIRNIERRIKDQEALVRRMIMQGSPTQSAEDLLRELTATLRQMREHRGVQR